MEQLDVFDFDRDEEQVVADALKMYASYMDMQTRFLVGDESDAGEINREARIARELAKQFHDATTMPSWEKRRLEFAKRHDRPMDIHDFSKFDFYEYYEG